MRFSQYKKFVALGDTGEDGFLSRLKRIRRERSAALKTIRDRASAAKASVRKNVPVADRLRAVIEIDADALRKTLQVQADFKAKHQALQAARLPPLTWREWLYEQAKLGDKAALSALRGIVYQAQRDAARQAKEEAAVEKEPEAAEKEPEGAERSSYREEQFHRTMKRLLEVEKKEIAIRAAQSNMMRPYEADALLARYAGIQWTITGNGNVRYSDHVGKHLFTDRGNRVTFDRVRVTDNEIRLALAHARQKFGSKLTLTGDDPIFTQRMARLADDMGITILNPELQVVIRQHRVDRALQVAAAIGVERAEPEQIIMIGQDRLIEPEEKVTVQDIAPADLPEQSPALPSEPPLINLPEKDLTADERLRALVLSIDPQAKFVTPCPADSKTSFHGVVVATLENELGFAQHIGRGVYALHPSAAPADHGNAAIEVKYTAGKPVAKVSKGRKGLGRAD